MILSKHEGSPAEPGREGGEDYASILLVQVHGEYGVSQAEIQDITTGYFSEQEIWDAFELSEVSEAFLDEETQEKDRRAKFSRINAAFDILFPGMAKALELSSGWGFNAESDNLLLISGRASELERYFEALCRSFNTDRLSGDDDAFDYWPNDLHAMLEPLADDLDKLFPRDIGKGKGQHRMSRVRQVEAIFVGVLTRTWGPGRLMEEWGPDPDIPGRHKPVSRHVAKHWSPLVEELVDVADAPAEMERSFGEHGIDYEDWEKAQMNKSSEQRTRDSDLRGGQG